MALRQLSAEEIDLFIKEDKIVWVACRNPHFGPLQGKFMKKDPKKGDSPSKDHYAFCPYKKGVSLPFLPAQSFFIEEDSKQHKKAMAEVLKAAFKRKRSF